ncbi:unnamed protein product, partial [Ixodes pacificus]
NAKRSPYTQAVNEARLICGYLFPTPPLSDPATSGPLARNSAVSDTVIFIFLGIVLVNKKHVWNTGFVVWSTALCLVYRFLTVFGLTYLVNTFGRIKKINLEEQFIMVSHISLVLARWRPHVDCYSSLADCRLDYET